MVPNILSCKLEIVYIIFSYNGLSTEVLNLLFRYACSYKCMYQYICLLIGTMVHAWGIWSCEFLRLKVQLIIKQGRREGRARSFS